MELEFDFHFDRQNSLRLECESVDMGGNNEIYGLVDRFSKSLFLGPDDLYCEIKEISANFEKRGLHLSNLMNSSSSSEEGCGYMFEGSSEFRSTSNGDFKKCEKLEFQLGEIEKLLEILEEDNHVMSKALFVGVEERSELVNEVYGLFQVIQQRIRDHQTADEKSLQGCKDCNWFATSSTPRCKSISCYQRQNS